MNQCQETLDLMLSERKAKESLIKKLGDESHAKISNLEQMIASLEKKKNPSPPPLRIS
jgi:hypothetical protein